MTYKEAIHGDPLAEILDNDGDPDPAAENWPGPEVLPRHLAAGGSETTLCGLDRAGHGAVHPSKAKKTDCPACRERWRALKARKIVFTQTSAQGVEPPPVPPDPAAAAPELPPYIVDVPPPVDKAAIDEAVRMLRLRGLSHRAIESAMGFKEQGGNRPWRICQRLGIK